MYTGEMKFMSRLADLDFPKRPRIVQIFMRDRSTSVDSLTVKLRERAQSRTRQTMSRLVNVIRRSVIGISKRSMGDSESALKAVFFQQLSILFGHQHLRDFPMYDLFFNCETCNQSFDNEVQQQHQRIQHMYPILI